MREIVRQRTLPRHFGCNMSAEKSVSRSAAGPVKKLRSKICRSYYSFLFISGVRFVSIPTLYCSGYWEGGLRCALIRCTLGSGKSEKGRDFGGEGTKGQWGTKGSSLQATWDRGGRFLSQLEGAK